MVLLGGRWQGAHDVHVDVGEPPGWDGDGLHRRRVLPGSFGSLTLLAVLDPCGYIAVETSPHHPGGNEPLGGPRTGVGQPMEGGEHGGPVNQRYQRPHPPLWKRHRGAPHRRPLASLSEETLKKLPAV